MVPLHFTAGVREVIPGILIPLSAKSVLLSRKKNIYQPLFSFVCSGSYTPVPVPVPCQTSAPPCPAMLFVATLSLAAGDTNVTTGQTERGQHSDTPAWSRIPPETPSWEHAECRSTVLGQGSTLGVDGAQGRGSAAYTRARAGEPQSNPQNYLPQPSSGYF